MRENEVVIAQEKTASQACKQRGMLDMIDYRRRQGHGGLRIREEAIQGPGERICSAQRVGGESVVGSMSIGRTKPKQWPESGRGHQRPPVCTLVCLPRTLFASKTLFFRSGGRTRLTTSGLLLRSRLVKHNIGQRVTDVVWTAFGSILPLGRHDRSVNSSPLTLFRHQEPIWPQFGLFFGLRLTS